MIKKSGTIYLFFQLLISIYFNKEPLKRSIRPLMLKHRLNHNIIISKFLFHVKNSTNTSLKYFFTYIYWCHFFSPPQQTKKNFFLFKSKLNELDINRVFSAFLKKMQLNKAFVRAFGRLPIKTFCLNNEESSNFWHYVSYIELFRR